MVKVWRWLPWALLAAAPLAAEDGRRLGPPVPGVEVRVAAAAAHPVQAAPAPVPGPAQTPAAQADLPVLTLLDCIEAALLSNPEVGISREAIQKAAGQRRTANGALLPSLDFTYSETWQQQTKVQLGGGGASVSTPGNTRNFALGASWPIFTGGALQANRAIAKLGEAAATYELRAKVQDIIARTVTAYLQLLRAQELLSVANSTVELAQEQVKVAKISEDAGAVPHVNVLRAEANLQNALQVQLQAANAIELAKASLNQIMGRSQLLPLRVAPLPRRLADPPPLLDSLQLAVVQRPELRAYQKNIEINRQAVKAAEAGYYPSLTLNGKVQKTMGTSTFGSEDSFAVVGVFHLNLWDWGQTSGKVKSARADAAAARQQLQLAMQGIELQVRRSVLNIAEARKRVEVATAEVTAAEQAYQIEQLRYKSGDGTFLELLDAQRSLSQARANLVTSYYDNALAEADWLAATGGYFATGGSLTLPQGQTGAMPAGFRGRGKDLNELMKDYGLDPKTEQPRAKDGAK